MEANIYWRVATTAGALTMSTDLKNDLAALRIDREPESSSRNWTALVLLVLFVIAALAGWWLWLGARTHR